MNNTTDALWLSFESMRLEKQVRLISKMTASDYVSFITKLFARNKVLATKVFKKLPFAHKSHLIKETKDSSTLFPLLAQSEQFRMVRENSSYCSNLSDKRFLVYIKAQVAKLGNNLQKKRGAFELVVNDKGVAEAQDVIAKYLSDTEQGIAWFFAKLSAEQKFLAFKKLPFTDYWKFVDLFQLFVVGMIDDHIELNPGSIGILLFSEFDEFDKNEHEFTYETIDELLPRYSDLIQPYAKELVRRNDSAQLSALIDAADNLGNKVLVENILKRTFQQMSDPDMRAFVKKYSRASLFIEPSRLFYLRNGNLNQNFTLLQQEVLTGKEIPMGSITEINRLRLLANVG